MHRRQRSTGGVGQDLTAALEAGRIVEISEEPTIADGCAGNIEPDSITFPMIQKHIDGMILVSEESIRQSMRRLAREEHLMVEGSAAVAVAGLAAKRIQENCVAAIVSGRNISWDLFASIQ